MVTREFEIVGENVVDAGLRPGLINKSVDYYVSVHVSHLSKNIVKVIINGDSESINEFVDVIQREDIRVKKDTPKTYQVSELKEYLGPEIDWNIYEIRFMSKQIYKGLPRSKYPVIGDRTLAEESSFLNAAKNFCSD